jgi:hypothetical protein
MMRSPLAAVMTASREWSCALASGTALIGAAVLPVAVLSAPYVPFPSQESLRNVQLAALACARENSPESCSKAKQLGDPLLDHPRLPANCKDLIWQMLDQTKPAATNSFSRREAISKPAEQLLLVCRSSDKPEATAAPEAKPKTGGINFGGSQR